MKIAKLESVSVTSARVSKLAEQASVAPDNFVPNRVLRAVNVPPLLAKLYLLEEHLTLIQAGLEKLGFSQREGELERSEGGETTTFHFTLVTNGSRRALLYLEDEILTIYSRANKLALEEVRDLFQGEFDTLYVFHDSNPKGTYKNLMQGEWPQKYRISTKFIPLSELEDLRDMTIEEQVGYLKRELDLAAAPAHPAAAAKKPPAVQMAINEMRKLAERIAKRPEFTDEGPRGRRVFVENAALREFAANFDFDGKPRTVASDLVTSLLDRGLGQLLEMMKDLEDLSDDDREFITGLLERYTFA